MRSADGKLSRLVETLGKRRMAGEGKSDEAEEELSDVQDIELTV